MTSRLVPRFLASLLLASACLAQTKTDQIDRTIQAYLLKKKFMGALLVARGDEILFNKGYGLADIENGVPNTSSTKFQIGSLTKQFTAASVLLLEERGKLQVTDPIRKYLPNAPTTWNEVTIFELLTHTAGITDNRDNTIPDPIKTTADNVARFRDRPLDFPPGKKWKYSNDGYILLGYLIETISGQSYEDFVSENIFKPMGMENSGYSSDSLIPGRALGYVSDHKNGLVRPKSFSLSVVHAAGALFSTTEDLLRWEQGLFDGRLLSAASIMKMTTPFKNDYGLGLLIETKNGHQIISHTGLINGFRAALTYYPADQLTIVVLGNVEESPVESIGDKLAGFASKKN